MNSVTTYIDHGCEKFIANSKDVEKAYNQACEWISEFGIDYKKTRFGDYERDVELFIKNRAKDGIEESVKVFMNAHMEAIEIIRVKKAFDSFDSTQIIETLKKTVSGQRFRNATNKDQSRDFAFELGVASRFIMAGYDVDLGGISDLIVNIDGQKLYIECKRLKSYSQLEKRVKAANQQIKSRLNQDRSSCSRGMIALNVTDIINANACPVFTTSVDEYKNHSAKRLKDFVLAEKKKFSKNMHKKTLGVFTEFTTQGIIWDKTTKNLAFGNIREGNIYSHLLKEEDRQFMDSFFPKISDQSIFEI